MSDDKPLTFEEKRAIARAPITVGILATHYAGRVASLAHAGVGPRPHYQLYDEHGRRVATQAALLRINDSSF